jgi:hypothetical protein
VFSVVLRYPVAHELGVDSFQIHSIVNIIAETGSMDWLVNYWAYFGLNPMSYPPAVPITVAAFAGFAGISVETAILCFSLLMGVTVTFTSFLLGRAVSGNDRIGCLTAFLISSSYAVVSFTNWILSTRGAFLVFVPFILALMLKEVSAKRRLSWPTLGPLMTTLAVLSLIHLMWLMFVPLLLATSLFARVAATEEAVLRHRSPYARRGRIVVLSLSGIGSISAALVFLRLPGAYDLSGSPTLTGAIIPDSTVTRMLVYYATMAGLGLALLPLGLMKLLRLPERRRQYLGIAMAASFLPAMLEPIYGVLLAVPAILAIVALSFYRIRGPREEKGATMRLSVAMCAMALCLAVILAPAVITVPRTSAVGCSQSPSIDPEAYDAGLYLRDQASYGHFSFVWDNSLNAARIEAVSGQPAVEGISGLATLGYPWLAKQAVIQFRPSDDPLSSLFTNQQLMDAKEWIPATSSQYDYFAGKHIALLWQTDPQTYLGSRILLFYSATYAVEVCRGSDTPFFTYLHSHSYVTYADDMEKIYRV